MILDEHGRKRVADKTGGLCFYGHQPLPRNWEADHYIPVNGSGADHESNLVPACPKHNREKSDRDPSEFLRRLQSDRNAAACGQ